MGTGRIPGSYKHRLRVQIHLGDKTWHTPLIGLYSWASDLALLKLRIRNYKMRIRIVGIMWTTQDSIAECLAPALT